MRGILTIQSWVSYGHVGNAAALFPLQRLGFEAWAVNTVQFSNHPGYGQFRGQVFLAESIRDIIQGIVERGVLPSVDAVLSGYLGDVGIGAVVIEAVRAVKAANPSAIWCCDPVMGDAGPGFYVRPQVPEFFRDQALALADIITPNPFELAFLTGLPVNDLGEALAACAAARALGPAQVLLTSFSRNGGIGLLLATASGAWVVEMPVLPITVNGAGDAVAALYLGYFLRLGDGVAALESAASALYGVLRVTMDLGEREIQLILAQDELVTPSRRFIAERVA